MKKIIILSFASLAALCACNKVSVNDAPATKISFEVASYVPQTKAEKGNNFKAEADCFFTNAWYTPQSGTKNQHFMAGERIELKDGVWQPADAYYWPRSGKVNFFSYASKHDLGSAEVDPGDAEFGKKFTITNHTVVADDNIMIADAVYNASKNDHNVDEITDDLAGGTDSGYKGVPTMFRHLLAQVSFKIGLGTASVTTGSTNYEAEITKVELKGVKKQGSITLNAEAPGTGETTLVTKGWTADTTDPNVGWTAGATTEDILFDTKNTKLTLSANQTVGNNTETYLDWRTVLPQTLSDDVEIEITFNLDTKHGTTPYASEKDLVAKAQLKKAMSGGSALEAWEMNKRIVYTLTIDPVTELITFDPAVEAWVPADAKIANLKPEE